MYLLEPELNSAHFRYGKALIRIAPRRNVSAVPFCYAFLFALLDEQNHTRSGAHQGLCNLCHEHNRQLRGQRLLESSIRVAGFSIYLQLALHVSHVFNVDVDAIALMDKLGDLQLGPVG